MTETSSTSSLREAALREVADTHVLIERCLRGGDAAGPALLDALLARFEPGFGMVTPGGSRLDYAALAAFLGAAAGTRPNLAIELADLRVLHAEGSAVWLTFREIQRMGPTTTQRQSSALLVADAGGAVRWRHLHETWGGAAS
ncbi:hypothetical protein [Janthinobacterium fluminis]|uniref:DUF4440 domain-containing protein n=1 Tax=Janthinobacterium fluminis TaxID=2987524 RepID=A0ABT5K1R1_9BURK|nr:hypothetical protein [Janthinobacterium fluminis]MDC8758919.1 hypothetical protein [Janthinobacterium fluminis]